MLDESKPISDRAYWEDKYLAAGGNDLLLEGFVNRPNRLILEKLAPLLAGARMVLEVGAGGSVWLPHLASRYPEKSFTGLDYSQGGCELLRKSSREKGLNLEVVQADMFDPPGHLAGKMDLVISFGVVEHFGNLPAALAALRRFTGSEGVVFTVIPNMHGVLGFLTRLLDLAVYGIHVPHDLGSFAAGHEEAGLRVCEAGYLCSSNFGVLSSAVPPSGIRFEIYRWLSRLSTLGWLFEERFFSLPATPFLAPFMYCIAKRAPEGSETCAS